MLATELLYHDVDSPIGKLRLVGDGQRLRAIEFLRTARSQQPEAGMKRSAKALAGAAAQLREFFAGRRRTFDLPLAPEGTPFQHDVWQELQKIPYGQTICYGELARRIGRPRAVRAVGAANGRNPLPIVIPCHRVIGSNGKLTGYAGGLDIKCKLLKLEGITCI